MSEKKESFVLYKSFYEPIKDLCKEDKSDLLDAIFKYQINKEEPLNTSRIFMPFLFFKNQFRLDNEKYLEVVKRNKSNGSKGGRPLKDSKPTETDINPNNPLGLKEPKKADKDNVKDNDNEIKSIASSEAPAKKINNIEERILKFADTLRPFIEKYGKETITDFYKYWKQPNKSNTKFKQELEKTWDVNLRLETWAKNEVKYGSKANKAPEGNPNNVKVLY